MTKDEKRKTKVKGKYTPKVDLEGLAPYFAAQPDVVVAYLFGSFAKGMAHSKSDVDIAILFDMYLDAEQRLQRERELERDLSRLATHKTDHCTRTLSLPPR